MAKMFWISRFVKKAKTTFHHNQTSPGYKKDVHNWRILNYGHVTTRYRHIEGVFLITDLCWFLPSMKLEWFVNHLKKGRDHEFEHYHFQAGDYMVPFCYVCKGGGKLDWLSKITGVTGHTDSAKYKFERDTSHVLQYIQPSGEPRHWQYLAVTKIEDGEMLCKNCLGTGILLDGRYKMFSARLFKKRLIRLEMSEALKEMLMLE